MTVASTGTFSNTLWLADVPKIGSGTPAMSGWSGAATSLNSSYTAGPTVTPPGRTAPAKSPSLKPKYAVSTHRNPPPAT